MSETPKNIPLETLLGRFLENTLDAEQVVLLGDLLADRLDGDGVNRDGKEEIWEQIVVDAQLRDLEKNSNLDLHAIVSSGSLKSGDPSFPFIETPVDTEMNNRAIQAALEAERQQESNGPAARTTNTKKLRNEKSSRSFVPLPILAGVFLIFFGTLIYFELNPSLTEDFDESVSNRPKTPACIVAAADVEWIGTNPPKPGEPLLPGPLRFGAGAIELLFFSGVRGIVEGPAELLLLDEKHVFCKRGQWSMAVPRQGSGFEIQTPNLSIRDIGTRFFASVDGETSEVHVLQGVVELEKTDGEKIRFETDQAVRHRGNTSGDRIEIDPSRFVTKDEMRRRSEAVLNSGNILESAPVRTIEFTQEMPHPAVDGGELVDGSTPDSKAFRYVAAKDRIRLRTDAEYPALTAVVRLKLDRIDHDMNPILMSCGAEKGGLVLYARPSGALVVGVRTRGGNKSGGTFETPIVLTEELLGRWIQLALSIDTRTRQLALHVDGDPIYTGKLPSTAKLKSGVHDIGSWVMNDAEPGALWFIDGAVERVHLFDRALNVAEIRNLP